MKSYKRGEELYMRSTSLHSKTKQWESRAEDTYMKLWVRSPASHKREVKTNIYNGSIWEEEGTSEVQGNPWLGHSSGHEMLRKVGRGISF